MFELMHSRETTKKPTVKASVSGYKIIILQRINGIIPVKKSVSRF